MKALTLQDARDAKGWTQEKLEAASGVSQAAISAIETGRVTDPAWSTVVELAKALDIDPRQLRFKAVA